MKQDKLYDALLDLYREVYLSLGYCFDDIDKTKDFYLGYQIDKATEDKIVNVFLNSRRLTKHQKEVIKINYYLGVSPRNI